MYFRSAVEMSQKEFIKTLYDGLMKEVEMIEVIVSEVQVTQFVRNNTLWIDKLEVNTVLKS